MLGGNGLDVTVSPFTLVFEMVPFFPGTRIFAHLMNGVILSAVLSAGNSGISICSFTFKRCTLLQGLSCPWQNQA